MSATGADGVPRRSRRARAADRHRRARRLRPQRALRGRAAGVRRARHARDARTTAPRSWLPAGAAARPPRDERLPESFPQLAGSSSASPATRREALELGRPRRTTRGLERVPDADRRGADPGRVLPGLPSQRGRAARGGPAVDVGGATASGTSRRDDPARHADRSACASTCASARPTTVADVARRLARARRRAARRRSASTPSVVRERPVLRPRRQDARRQPARAGLKFERGLSDRRREADGDHVVQLPPGSLRRSTSASGRRTGKSRTPPASASASSASRSRCSARTGSTRRAGRPGARAAAGLDEDA